jgi:hypothetical protein
MPIIKPAQKHKLQHKNNTNTQKRNDDDNDNNQVSITLLHNEAWGHDIM